MDLVTLIANGDASITQDENNLLHATCPWQRGGIYETEYTNHIENILSITMPNYHTDDFVYSNSELEKLSLPKHQHGEIGVMRNQLRTLLISRHITGSVDCSENNLTELHLPIHEYGNIKCNYNSLTELDLPNILFGNVNCSHNKLTKLNLPLHIQGNIICSYNNLKKLNLTNHKSGDVDCSYNSELGKDAELLTTFRRIQAKGNHVFFNGIVFPDGTAMFDNKECKVIKTQTSGLLTVYETDSVDFRYVATNRSNYGYANSIHTAINELASKEASDKSVEIYNSWTNEEIDSPKSITEILNFYGKITGIYSNKENYTEETAKMLGIDLEQIEELTPRELVLMTQNTPNNASNAPSNKNMRDFLNLNEIGVRKTRHC